MPGVESFLTGQLLVATPHTGGDVFRRSVVLLLHHGDDGAQGVVLNKPLEAEVDAVLPPWQKYVTPPARLFQGGPVALDSALGIAGYAGWSAGQLEGEIEAGGWYVVDAEARDAFTPEPAVLWSSVLRPQRANLALVATFPEDPAMN